MMISILALSGVRPAFAHGGEPRLEISAERLNPGSVLEIRGVDFEFEEQVTLSLIGSQVEVPLGSVVADTEGIFVLTIALPVDLVEGDYTVRATTSDHIVNSPQIAISGIAYLGNGDDGQHAEDDGLLAPMPTPMPSVATAVPQAAPSLQNAPTENSSSPFVWIASGIGIIAVLFLILRVKR